jgi:multiple sugar transport system permease protein
LFDQAYVLTKGGPGHATRTPVYHIYEMGFNRLRMGYASALSLVLFLIIFAVTLVNLRLNREQNLLTE